MRKLVVPAGVVLLGLWLVADPRGLSDTAQDGGGRAWETTGEVVASALALLDQR